MKTKAGTVTKKQLLKLVRIHCTWCYGGSHKQRALCESYDCALWPHRNGNTEPEKRQKMPEPADVKVDKNGNVLRTSFDDFPECE